MTQNLQKSLFIVSAIIMMLCAAGCTKDLVGFEMTYKRNFTVKGGLSPSQGHYFVMNDFAANFSGFAKAKNSDITQVKEILPRSMRFTSKFADANFDAVRGIEVRVSKSNFDQGTEVFYYPAPIPLGRNFLDISAGLANIKDIVGNDDKFNIIVRIDFLYSPQQELELITEFGFIAVTK
jgi:hypothetical protein